MKWGVRGGGEKEKKWGQYVIESRMQAQSHEGGKAEDGYGPVWPRSKPQPFGDKIGVLVAAVAEVDEDGLAVIQLRGCGARCMA